MSAETERENLAEAEQEVRYAVECGDEITVDRDVLRTVMAEYDRLTVENRKFRGAFSGAMAAGLVSRELEAWLIQHYRKVVDR